MELGVGCTCDAVWRPRVYKVGVLGEVVAGFDMPVLEVVTMRSYSSALSVTKSAIRSATALPPFTPRAPPSQNVGWTSTMSSAR